MSSLCDSFTHAFLVTNDFNHADLVLVDFSQAKKTHKPTISISMLQSKNYPLFTKVLQAKLLIILFILQPGLNFCD